MEKLQTIKTAKLETFLDDQVSKLFLPNMDRSIVEVTRVELVSSESSSKNNNEIDINIWSRKESSNRFVFILNFTYLQIYMKTSITFQTTYLIKACEFDGSTFTTKNKIEGVIAICDYDMQSVFGKDETECIDKLQQLYNAKLEFEKHAQCSYRYSYRLLHQHNVDEYNYFTEVKTEILPYTMELNT